jgi:hypothetical protein
MQMLRRFEIPKNLENLISHENNEISSYSTYLEMLIKEKFS